MVETRRVTLQDVGDALGLSSNTVSRALNGKSGVSEATRDRVRREAERLGYVPNIHARSLVLGSRRSIGLVITNPSNPFYSELISEIEVHAAAAGYSLLLMVSEESEDREVAATGTILQSGLDGVLLVSVQADSAPWQALQRTGVPIVLINRELKELEATLVSTDNELGGYIATEHVIFNGARRIVLMEEDLPISTVQRRMDGFQRAVEEAGLTGQESIVQVPTRRSQRATLPWQADDAYRIACDLLDRQHIPDAFVVGNDYFALGLYRALRERGLGVPADVLVVGFGDYPFSSYLHPSLSSVRLPARQVGQIAVEALISQITNVGNADRTTTMIDPILIVRESTRRLGEPSE